MGDAFQVIEERWRMLVPVIDDQFEEIYAAYCSSHLTDTTRLVLRISIFYWVWESKDNFIYGAVIALLCEMCERDAPLAPSISVEIQSLSIAINRIPSNADRDDEERRSISIVKELLNRLRPFLNFNGREFSYNLSGDELYKDWYNVAGQKKVVKKMVGFILDLLEPELSSLFRKSLAHRPRLLK